METTIALIGAIVALITGIAAWQQARTAARKADMDVLCDTLSQLREENQRLVQRLEALESENTELRKKLSGYEAEITRLQRRVSELERERAELMRQIPPTQDAAHES